MHVIMEGDDHLQEIGGKGDQIRCRRVKRSDPLTKSKALVKSMKAK